jgi:hypothetical protein
VRSPEPEIKTFTADYTDDTDQEKDRGNGHRRGRRCHTRVAGTAIRKIVRVSSFLEGQIGRHREQAAHKGLRLFESALGLKTGQLSVLEFG